VGQLTFYFDICFGKRFPESIAKAKPPFAIEYHGGKGNTFRQDMPDDKWLHIVGERGWVVFSHDRRFHKESASASAIRHHKIGCFYLHGAQLTTWEKLYLFMKAHHRICELASSTERPYVYHVTALNRINRIELTR
jgi:PIN like domain